jgi:hypothetical protein
LSADKSSLSNLNPLEFLKRIFDLDGARRLKGEQRAKGRNQLVRAISKRKEVIRMFEPQISVDAPVKAVCTCWDES